MSTVRQSSAAQSAEQAAVDAEELDAKEGDGQIDGHFDQRMPAGLLERAFKLNGLVVDAFAALQYGLEGEEQQQEGVDVVGVLNAAGVDAG